MNREINVEMHPFMKYPGGKTKEIPLVLNNLPKTIVRYIEPFVGGGSIYYAMNITNSLINDKSFDLSLLFKLVKEQNLKLKDYLISFADAWDLLDSSTINTFYFNADWFDIDAFKEFYFRAKNKKNKTIIKFEEQGLSISNEDHIKIDITAMKTALYMLIRKIYNDKNISDELHIASFYFLREYAYSSMFRFSSKGDFNVPYGGMSYNNKTMRLKINYMFSSAMKNYMKNTVIHNEDFEVFMKEINVTENDFIFLDPPYDTDFSTYDNNPFDRNEQIRLRDCLQSIKANWMLIIKKTDFIYDLYKNFFIYEYNLNYMVSFKNRNKREVKHLLITNYKLNTEEE